MKIVLLGHDDIASLVALDMLVRQLPAYEFTVFVSGKLTPKHPLPQPLEELAAADEALCQRFSHCLSAPFRARQALAQPNSPAGLEALHAAAPDLVVSIRYRRILRDAAIAIPAHGVLNLHSGVLPDYQGVMATFWAMQNGAQEIGCTLHRIVDAGIDTGPVVGIARMPNRAASYLLNVLSLYPAGVDLLVSAIGQLAAGSGLSAASQARGAGHYYTTPDAEALARFGFLGLRLCDGREAAWIEKLYKSVNNADCS